MEYPQIMSIDIIRLKHTDPKTSNPPIANTERLEPRAEPIPVHPPPSTSQQPIRPPEPDPELFPTYVPTRWRLSKRVEEHC